MIKPNLIPRLKRVPRIRTRDPTGRGARFVEPDVHRLFGFCMLQTCFAKRKHAREKDHIGDNCTTPRVSRQVYF